MPAPLYNIYSQYTAKYTAKLLHMHLLATCQKSMQPKTQHYVPQVYLRNFAIRRKKEFFIGCFDKVTRKTFKPNVKNVVNQTGFYNFVTSEGEKASIESFFLTTQKQR